MATDNLNTVGKFMNESRSKADEALKRVHPLYPVVERSRDVFDAENIFSMDFKTFSDDSRVVLDIYFSLPPPLTSAVGCIHSGCVNFFEFTGGSHLENIGQPYREGSAEVYLNGEALDDAQWTETSPKTGEIYIQGSLSGPDNITVCFVSTRDCFNGDGTTPPINPLPPPGTDLIADPGSCYDGFIDRRAYSRSNPMHVGYDDGDTTYNWGGQNSGAYVGSWVWYNHPWTDSNYGCPIGGGGWTGFTDNEIWAVINAPADNPAYLGLIVTVDPTYAYTNGYTDGYYVCWADKLAHDGPPDMYDYPTIIGTGPEPGSPPRSFYIPRSLINWGTQNAVVLKPTWLCGGRSPSDFYCNSLAYFGNPHNDGRGNSGSYRNLAVTQFCTFSLIPGTTGWVSDVSPYGTVDGINTTYTLIGWNGTGDVFFKMGGEYQSLAEAYIDRTAKTITLLVAPATGSMPLFSYYAEP